MSIPAKLYLERWPEECGRDDTIFYEPTGYGVDQDGNTSHVYVYVRESDATQDSRIAQAAREYVEAENRFDAVSRSQSLQDDGSDLSEYLDRTGAAADEAIAARKRMVAAVEGK